jgi:hypothetical protein
MSIQRICTTQTVLQVESEKADAEQRAVKKLCMLLVLSCQLVETRAPHGLWVVLGIERICIGFCFKGSLSLESDYLQ